MCGILAVLGKGMPQDLQKISSSSKVLESRGPDCSCTVNSDGNLLTFKRLAINDLTQKGNQPFIRNGVMMVCNGEIYNHKELEAKFGIECTSKSDCEVILHLYKKIGFVEMTKLIRGVFALVLIEGDNVWFVRDLVGVRPLFVGWTKDKFLALSSLASCLLPFATKVTQVKPGICYYHQKGTYTINYIHDLGRTPIPKQEGKLLQLSIALREKVINSVRKRLMSERPIGCLLSGGLDSTIIAAILVLLLGAQNVRTYSIGLKNSLDLEYAKKAANFLETNHTEVIFTPKQGLEVIPDVISAIESYDVTTIRASIPMYLLAQYISKNTKDTVVFSGEGADELFCGYLYFHHAPTPYDAHLESRRLIRQLHKYDVLRADRCVSSHGLELRVPFLDQEILDFALGLPHEYQAPYNRYEKYILRLAFEDLLPGEILLRRKDGLSDGVSNEKLWFEYIQEYVDTRLSDEVFNSNLYVNKEQMYYRLIFERLFPRYELELPMWCPKWVKETNPSGRLIKI